MLNLVFQSVRDRHRHVVVSQLVSANGDGIRKIAVRDHHQDVPRIGRGKMTVLFRSFFLIKMLYYRLKYGRERRYIF